MSRLNSLKNCLREISPISFIIFAIIIAGALFVRLYGISDYAFNDDELWHLVVADQKNLWDVIQHNFEQEVHPPLSYVVWHYMQKISHNDLWLRMSGIIPGILLIPSIYIFGRLYIGGRAAAYTLAFIFAFGAMPLSMSTSIRAYPMMMLALTWGAIFIHKYRFGIPKKPRDKYLIYYFLCALAAIELNHSAALCIFSLGLILFVQTLKEKNQRDFILIAAIHAILGALLIGYAIILKHYYGFNGVIPGFYASYGNPIYYLDHYMKLFLWFPLGSDIHDLFAAIFSLISIVAFFVVPVALIRARKFLLLQLIFVPLFLVIITDVLRVFPFSPMLRNNLFLFLSVAIVYAYFIQIFTNKFAKLFKEEWFESRKKIADFLKIFAVLIATIFFTIYVSAHDSFRKTWPGCNETSIAKSDTKALEEIFNKKNSAKNVFVTAARNIWYFQNKSSNQGKITIITKHVAKFENESATIYFMAFPARFFNTNVDMLEHKLFFTDLFEHLKSEKKFAKIESFTFFDIGLGVDYLTLKFLPEFETYPKNPFPSSEDKMIYKYWLEGYEIGWRIHSSKEMLDKIYFRDISHSCGREVLFLTFTPQFVYEEFLQRDFIDGRKFDKERRGL